MKVGDKFDGYRIYHEVSRPEDLTEIYLTESHSDSLGWLIIMEGFDFCESLINALEARELAAALLRLADDLDANVAADWLSHK